MQKKPKDWPKGKQWVDPTTSVNFRAFRRTCATWFQKVGGPKDVQAQMRHTTPNMTFGVYVQELPESVRTAVEALDQKLWLQAGRSEAGRRCAVSTSGELLHNCTHVSGARKTRSPEVFQKLIGYGRGGAI